MNSIESNNNLIKKKKKREKGILGVTKGPKMLFSFNSRELWPEDEEEEDIDYSPPIDKSINDSNERVVGIKDNESIDKLNEDLSNGCIDDRTVAPIKISKNMKNKRKNWAIVGEHNQVINGSDCSDSPVKKRGRKRKVESCNGFVVKKMSPHKNGNKVKSPKKSSPTERKNSTKRNSDCVQKSTNESKNTVNKLHSNYEFNRLSRPLSIDFEQILPQEMLIKIFDIVLEGDKDRMQSIINLSQVCESWRKLIITTPLLWQSLDLHSFADEKFPHIEFQRLNDENQLFNNIRELNLNGWNGGNAERVLQTIASNSGENLREISLKNCRNISTNFLQTISSHCPNIEILDISTITYSRIFGTYIPRVKNKSKSKASAHQNSQSPFASPVFRPLLELCGNKLLSLNLSENTMPSFPSCITAIMELCLNLEVLDISNVESLTKSTSIAVEKLQNSCPKLRIFRAANITLTSSPSILTNGFTNLEELSIPFNANFSTAIFMNAHTDNVIEQLTKSADKMKLLDIRGARYLTPRALVKIPAWNIQHLSISNCPKLHTEQLEMAFTKWNRSLIDVDISWNICEDSVNSCLKTLCEVAEDSQLRTIQLRGSAVSYESLKSLVKSCSKLESIDLQSCRGLPRGIKRCYSGQEFINLRNEIIEGKYD